MKRDRVLQSFLLALLFSVSLAYSISIPDKKKTLGLANPELTMSVICSREFRTGDWRNVPESEKHQVMEEYGLSWELHKNYEFDHLIPLELGGDNDIRNLWPQMWREARKKDRVENYLHRQVCEGRMTLEEAQQEVAWNWEQVYRRIRK